VTSALDGPSARELRSAAEALNGSAIVIVQHEYGLYDGPDGESVLDIMGEVTVPMVVVAHTVLSRPTANQRRVLEEACGLAGTTVVMTETARRRLVNGFDVDPAKIVVIAHGAATPFSDRATVEFRSTSSRPRVLTWGLLGPGKGIEWAIDAMAALGDLDPIPDYVIAGATHPKVRVTAFFHSAYSPSTLSLAILGSHCLSLPQLARRSSTSFQNPTARPAA